MYDLDEKCDIKRQKGWGEDESVSLGKSKGPSGGE
jgi:hypothetical protein